MVSGIVYFDEIIENIKDATGIENMRPLYSRIRRFCYNCEGDIGAGGVIVLKKKEYEIGDGFYDGKSLILPEDFVSEHSYNALSNGILQGNLFRLYEEGAAKVDFKYLGFLMDEEGNPFTTRNRLDAIVQYSVWRLYSSRYFLGEGNRNQNRDYEQSYKDAIMEARGLDAFPSEEDWNILGAIRLGGAIEAMTDCGMRTLGLGTQDPSFLNTDEPKGEPVCKEFISGISNGLAAVTGWLKYYLLVQMEGTSNGSSSASATLGSFVSPEHQLRGISNGVTTVSGLLLQSITVVACNDSFAFNGNAGTFSYQIDFGSGTGMCGINYDAFSVPDRFRIEWNGSEVGDTGYVGSDSQDSTLINLGIDPGDINTATPGTGQGQLLFNKVSAFPNVATIYVDAPLAGTGWNIQGVCPP